MYMYLIRQMTGGQKQYKFSALCEDVDNIIVNGCSKNKSMPQSLFLKQFSWETCNLILPDSLKSQFDLWAFASMNSWSFKFFSSNLIKIK